VSESFVGAFHVWLYGVAIPLPDPIGRARAQWMAWESAGKPARAETHSTWLDVVRGT
jgi:hypothetical protein